MENDTALQAKNKVAAKARVSNKYNASLKICPYVFIAPFILFYLAFNIFPILYSFITSFTNWDGFSAATFVGLQNYKLVFTQDPSFWKSLEIQY